MMLMAFVKTRELTMDNERYIEDDARKLTFVVVFLAVVVGLLFGLGPLI